MKIFLTGGSGFIGSHFINLAHSEGHEVVALRRPESAQSPIRLNKQPAWITYPLGTLERRFFSGCEAVVHLAAHSMSPPGDTLENCLKFNVIKPLELFTSAVESGISRFVVAGSCFEFGRTGERYEQLPPDAPLEPTNNYAISKATASMAFAQLAIDRGLKLSIHRIFHVFGNGEAYNRFWPSLRRAAQNGEDFPMTLGEQVRDFVPVETVVDALLESVVNLKLEAGKPVFTNIGTGRAVTLLKFANDWWHTFGGTGRLLVGQVPYRPSEVMRYVPQL